MTQKDALAILKTGRNVFLTGEPGAGKTHTVNAYVTYLKSHGIASAITASTGIAATHIGGMTVHSFSGIGISKYLSPQELTAIAGKKNVADRIRAAKVLIIDEISMLDARTLDLIDAVCRAVKEPFLPFGGLQVIFVGDFFQLPPVSRNDDPPPEFAFKSYAWQQAAPTVCYLSEQHRQEDGEFLRILSAIRKNAVTDDHKDTLASRAASLINSPVKSGVTKLFPHNADVDRMNDAELSKIPGVTKTFKMRAFGIPPLIEQLKRGCLSPEVLTLKKGARVMFTKNAFFGGYVNGTTGEVFGFDQETGYPLVKLRTGAMIMAEPTEWKIEADSKVLASIVQLPLRLAWAMTVHKSQGMSLDAAFVDLSGAFAYGQGYVALSRVRTLEGLYLAGINERALEVDASVLKADDLFREQSLDAERGLAGMTEAEITEMHEAFVIGAGGRKEVSSMSQPIIAIKEKKKKEPKYTETIALFLKGKTLLEVATERARTVGTIIGHLEEMKTLKILPKDKLAHLEEEHKEVFKKIHTVFGKLGAEQMKGAYEHLEGAYTYDLIRFARVFYDE
jgi:ATP-dependent DNA helicase PIF1